MAAVRPIVAGRQGHAPQRQAGQVIRSYESELSSS